jgi:uncharacterized protein YfaS (alpha-2-macroglobulin family)
MHIEYYRDKLVMFIRNLSKGSHKFTADIIPRFSGKYTLNPASAELMYIPPVQGNNAVKQVIVR